MSRTDKRCMIAAWCIMGLWGAANLWNGSVNVRDMGHYGEGLQNLVVGGVMAVLLAFAVWQRTVHAYVIASLLILASAILFFFAGPHGELFWPLVGGTFVVSLIYVVVLLRAAWGIRRTSNKGTH